MKIAWVCIMLGAFSCNGHGGRRALTPADIDRLSDEELVSRLNARARRGATSETVHGTVIEDPYRGLEEESADTRAWIDVQTARTERRLSPHVTDRLRSRITSLMSIGVLMDPELGEDRAFFMSRGEDQEQPLLMVRRFSNSEPARVLLDPNDLGERVAIDWYFPSPSGALVAVGLSRNGDERSVLHLFDVETGVERPESIPNCKWSTLSWLADETGFYYTRYPHPGEPDFNAEEPDTYFPRIFFHRVGDDPTEDSLVWGSEQPQDFPTPSVSDDDGHLVINVMRGWSVSDVYLLDLTSEGAEPQPVAVGCDCLTSGAVRRGRLWLISNEDHPRYRVLAVAPEDAGDREQWREVIPESEAPIEQFGVAEDRLVIHEINGFASRIRFTTLEGDPTGELELPALGSVGGLALQSRSSRALVLFSSFFYPPTLLAVDTRTGRSEPLEQVEADIDTSRYEVTQETVTSADGTAINVFLVHRSDAPPDGSHPTLLYGYGGFNISLMPYFSRRPLYWLERGGIYAVANLRGGGELGEEWHRAGQFENKERVFEDFEAVVRWLGRTWSSPERIAIMGGSNGGLLVGATLVRCPDAFAAAVGYVGLYDMVRYHRFPPAGLWASEYGSAEDEAQFRYLHAYSPYHNLRPGERYPATLIETADHDTRVHWGHSTKFAARLQESAEDAGSILFFMDHAVGHGAGTGRSDLVDQTVRLYAFLDWSLGLDGNEGVQPSTETPSENGTEERETETTDGN